MDHMNLFWPCKSTWSLVSHLKQHLYSLEQETNTDSVILQTTLTCKTFMCLIHMICSEFLHHLPAQGEYRHWSLTFCMAASQVSDCFLCSSGEGTTLSLTSSISSCSLYFKMRPLTHEFSKQSNDFFTVPKLVISLCLLSWYNREF